MYAVSFTVTVDSEDHTRLRLSGELDYEGALELNPQFLQITDQCSGELQIDLEQITFIDSEGIKLLLTAYARMRKKGGSIRLIGLSPCVQRVIRLAGVQGILLPEESESVLGNN